MVTQWKPQWHTFTTRGLPGSFADCAPDRWGKNLITKRLAAESRAVDRRPSTVSDIDLLVGVADETRQGALRFRGTQDRHFLHQRSPPMGGTRMTTWLPCGAG